MDIAQIEERSSQVLAPRLKKHLGYLSLLYNFIFEVTSQLNGQETSATSEQLQAQLIILHRIADYIRPIQILCSIGYTEQAGTLAASIFELAHTIILFAHDTTNVQKWLRTENIDEKYPKDFFGKTWAEIVRYNYTTAGFAELADNNYMIYKNLCLMKHSHPRLQGIDTNGETVSLRNAPYFDDINIQNTKIIIKYIGRVVELSLSEILRISQWTNLNSSLNGIHDYFETLD